MSYVQKRYESRGAESLLVNALLLGVMVAGTVMAVLVLIATVGCVMGVFAF